MTWHTTKYGDPYSEFVLCIYPILSARTRTHTHTHARAHTRTHTQSSGQPLRRPGSSWGFGALLKGTSVMLLKVERALYIHSPHRQFLPDLRLELATFRLLSNHQATTSPVMISYGYS